MCVEGAVGVCKEAPSPVRPINTCVACGMPERSRRLVCGEVTIEGVKYRVCDEDWRAVMDAIYKMRQYKPGEKKWLF